MAEPAELKEVKTGPLPRSSRRQYRDFLKAYKERRLDDSAEGGEQKKVEESGSPAEAATVSGVARWLRRGKQREYLRDYVRWLKPHRFGILGVFVLALLGAGLEMI